MANFCQERCAARRSYGGRVPDRRRPDRTAPAPARDTQERSLRRRESLLAAGVALLGERGWHGITSRGVAERAGTHAGLVHYHFGGLPTLKREVAAAAVAAAFEPALASVTGHEDWRAGLAEVVREIGEVPPAQARASAELIAAAMHDEQVAEVLRAALADARDRLVPWLAGAGAAEPEGLATLVVAALDGLLLHRLVDPGLPLHPAASAVEALPRRA